MALRLKRQIRCDPRVPSAAIAVAAVAILAVAKAMEDVCVRICVGSGVGIQISINISVIVVVALIGSSLWPAPQRQRQDICYTAPATWL